MSDASNKKIGSVMVVGAGIAGVQASLDLAEMGYYVHLVEKTPAIGGRMAQLDKTFPTNDCSMCIISPKLNEVGGHINVEIHTCSELLDLKGKPGNMKAKILKKARFVDLDKCTGCGECANACPIDMPNLFNMGLDENHPVYKPYAQAYPTAYAIQKFDTSPCTITCPANVNAHGYVSLVKEGRYKEAMEVIMEVLPLPGVLGRICFHPCEQACRRAEIDEPVSIRDLKRLAADQADILEIEVPCEDEKAEKVGIIGAGPGGLAAAYHLAKKGYKPTIFEANSVPGGMLRLGIPDYRLPVEVINKEVEAITRLGVEIKYNTPLGPDLTIEDLEGQGYKAIFLAMGAHGSRTLNVEGEDAEGIIPAMSFLKDVNLGEAPSLGKKVLVIGGGNVAVDVARSALRLSSKEITMISLESADEMPAWEWEIEEAKEEGVTFLHSWGPRRFMVENGRVTGLELKAVTQVFDAEGRFSPEYDESKIETIEADTVIVAIGQAPLIDPLSNVDGLTFTRGGNIEVDSISLATGRDGVFAAGDMQTGPRSAIEAVAGGKEAAISIDRYLKGEDLTAGREPIDRSLDNKNWRDMPANEKKRARLEMPKIPLEQRKTTFDEIELGFDPELGELEASKCLACGLCCECHRCVAACEAGAVTLETHKMQDEIVDLEVGSVVLAAGFDAFDPTRFQNYQYSESPNVLSAMEFERVLSASGPYQGHLIRPSDHKEPKKIAWLQCVGSRDINNCDRPYCSAVCCMYAIKEAIIAKEHSAEELDTTIFFMDMRTYGKDFEKYYERAKELGIKFVRCRIHTIDRTSDENLIIRYADETGQVKVEEYDMVTLSVGLEPSAEFTELAERLGVDLTEDGFVSTSTFEPVKTSQPGIYVCGAINEPKDIPISVMEASAAASAASSELSEVRFTQTKTIEYPPEQEVADQAPRIGVFICHCGINIGGVVDVPAVAEYASTLPFVELADHNLFTCSQDTQGKIQEAITEHNLNRVVVASCSPRTHEPMFRETLAKAGLNKYLFEMANIRDHNSWVHRDQPEKATDKAKDLVRGAVAKVALLEPLHQTQMGLTKEAIVIGGGVAGMTAALSIAEQGFPIHLVEKSDHLGGNALNLNKTWRGEDIKSFTQDLIKKVEASKLVTIHYNSEITKCDGFLGNFVSEIKTPEGTISTPHGAVVVASGGKALKPDEYLYGQHDRVLTSLELDALMVEKSKTLEQAKSVAFIQCVGSREPDRPYCSKICCTHSVESAIKIKEANPETTVYIIYRDVRTYGFRESLYKKARELGVLFIRYDVDDKPKVEAASPEELKLTVTDPILGLPLEINCDIVCLAAAILPNEGEVISEAYKVSLNAEGFFLEAHMKLRPVDFANEGMFLAGLAHYPKPIEESIAQARAAAARTVTILAKESISVGGIVAVVDPDKCAVCLTCVRTCPFGVPRIGEEGHAVIEPAICQGCGACVSECPGKAISLQHFTDEQLLAKTRALIA
ncbi:MAG: FAD-dependent oxidoreductase [Deltaproteobacteria bacterium]|nr:FAD-dependent oxidoreductase [Deltaproteobacteria bacterium]MBW2139474.1 FAD-dependent oxidoreductase [Deltaproteobacteria bacterium]